MSASLVGSEMCIRDRACGGRDSARAARPSPGPGAALGPGASQGRGARPWGPPHLPAPTDPWGPAAAGARQALC
eukprot:3330757-Alexandrium_andersonii.AAC.1